MQEKSTVCLNGRFVAAQDAVVSVADRGFRFGDGVFETIAIRDGVPFQWAFHMDRLARALAAVHIAPLGTDWKATAKQLLTDNALRDGFLRITISRGVGSVGYMPTASSPSWVMECVDMPATDDTPLDVCIASYRRVPPACLPVNHKLAHGIGATLALLEAQDQGVQEAIQLTVDGILCEAAGANLFWMVDGELFTPSLATGCLEGSTRHAILAMAAMPLHEVCASLEALENADCAFLTNCRYGIRPIRSVVAHHFAFSTEHSALRALQQRFAQYRENAIATDKTGWMAT